MSRFGRLPLTLGGLGAVAVLGMGASFAVGSTENKTNAVRSSIDGAKPKNVIFFLGDGMGTQEITAARFYKVGAAGKLNVDRLPFTGFDKTWSVKPDGVTPDYVPDSAATGTEWATGKKTIDDRDSQGPSAPGTVGDNANYKTVLEYAQASGKKVGDVTTADLTDATPAVLAAHISNRNCSGPDNMTAGPAATPKCLTESKEAGGLGSIAEQEADHKIDVALGGGYSRFAQTITGGPDAGKTVIQSAQGKGINVVTDAAGLAAATSAKPVLGLFGQTSPNAPNMSLEWRGSQATPGAGSAPETCQEDQRPADEPSLSAMTSKAIGLLDNSKGFFLQVEGASIDKQDHAANACQQIGETIAFDNAIGVALDYQKTHPDTLIVVTADHGHTSEIVPEDIASGSSLPTGYTNNLTTKDGQDLRITYGSAGYGGAGAAPVSPPPSQQHTGTVVPVWGSGPQATNILGTNDHTDLFDLLRGAKDDQPAPGAPPAKTVTTTAPTVTVQAPPDKTPRLGVAVIRRISTSQLRSSGLAVALTVQNANSVKLTLKKGAKTVVTRTVTKSGNLTLKVKGAKKGTYVLTISGAGKASRYAVTVG